MEVWFVPIPACHNFNGLDSLIRLHFVHHETAWSCCKLRDIGHGSKAVFCGTPTTTSGVGMIVPERFRNTIACLGRFDDCLMMIIVVEG
ncbi:unnamed protein product [Heligmosomoides polygyrus]|uniref:Retrotransposon protein n=1 Tax=Heligmosomoides polygyrus TaxID=6339 RepID=A0A183FZD7_HELPZ|nr:unnamed protein product [Heligmosomoides polygyrus]